MLASHLTCPSCGASEVKRADGRFSCRYCGASVVPRLVEGAICGESEGCAVLAQSLCRGCARPLCDRHNDPKFLYWSAPLECRRLMPRWTDVDARAWARLTTPVQHFPLRDFAPFPWVEHERRCLFDLGELEDEILREVRRVARGVAGDANDNACRFESLCRDCEGEVAARIESEVSGFAARYRQLAYANRLDALQADLLQARRYVELFLGHPVPEAGQAAPFVELSAESRPEEWESCGREIAERLRLVDSLASRSDRGTAPRGDMP